MKLRFGTDAQHGDIEALADARRALKNVFPTNKYILKVEILGPDCSHITFE